MYFQVSISKTKDVKSAALKIKIRRGKESENFAPRSQD